MHMPVIWGVAFAIAIIRVSDNANGDSESDLMSFDLHDVIPTAAIHHRVKQSRYHLYLS